MRLLLAALALVVLPLATGCDGGDEAGAAAAGTGAGTGTDASPSATRGTDINSEPRSETGALPESSDKADPDTDATPDTPVEAKDRALRGTRWNFVGVLHDGENLSVPSTSRAHLKLGSGRLGGFAGCNTYSGPYRTTASSVTLGKMVYTARACYPSSRTENAIFSVLHGTLTYVITGDRMTLTNSSGDVLRLKAA